MSLKDEKHLEDHENYHLVFIKNAKALVFSWKEVTNITVEDYKEALRKIAAHTEQQKPYLLLVDKRQLQTKIEFDIRSWWTQEILPIYHKAGISGFAHISGDPNAAGEHKQAVTGVNFKMAEFKDLTSALQWKV